MSLVARSVSARPLSLPLSPPTPTFPPSFRPSLPRSLLPSLSRCHSPSVFSLSYPSPSLHPLSFSFFLPRSLTPSSLDLSRGYFLLPSLHDSHDSFLSSLSDSLPPALFFSVSHRATRPMKCMFKGILLGKVCWAFDTERFMLLVQDACQRTKPNVNLVLSPNCSDTSGVVYASGCLQNGCQCPLALSSARSNLCNELSALPSRLSS